jgi:hypothetical protein
VTIDTDYVVLGAGAMGMAFTDVVLTETDATITLVDRQGRPGGHWNHAYPFVRLHQPSSFYGVDSRPLGGDAKDVVGWNAGLFELATVIPHPDTEVDWLRVALGGILNRARWAEDPGVSAWLAESRLDPFSGNQADLAEIDPVIIESVGTLLEHTPAAIINLQRLIEEADETPD